MTDSEKSICAGILFRMEFGYVFGRTDQKFIERMAKKHPQEYDELCNKISKINNQRGKPWNTD